MIIYKPDDAKVPIKAFLSEETKAMEDKGIIHSY